MDYLKILMESYPDLKPVENDLYMSFKILISSILLGGTIYTCGNGGSAADPEHIVCELMKEFRFKRELNKKQIQEITDIFPEEADKIEQNLQQTIPAVFLMTSIPLSTAGNSINVLHAVKIARVKGMKVVGLTGSKGGDLVKYSDAVIKASSNDVARIQEYHLSIYHCLYSMLEHEIFSNSQTDSHRSKNYFPSKTDLIVFDFDGVFTNNKVYTAQDGSETVICDRRDSLGINMLKKSRNEDVYFIH